MAWTIEFHRRALKDARKLKSAKLDGNLKKLLDIMREDPYTLPYEKLSGNLQGYYSRRINIKHRLVYAVDDAKKRIRVISVWSHYE
ncbi:MAG: Txe/YoeB family addiction module toxin [Cyanobacteria bacterium J06597_16]